MNSVQLYEGTQTNFVTHFGGVRGIDLRFSLFMINPASLTARESMPR